MFRVAEGVKHFMRCRQQEEQQCSSRQVGPHSYGSSAFAARREEKFSSHWWCTVLFDGHQVHVLFEQFCDDGCELLTSARWVVWFDNHDDFVSTISCRYALLTGVDAMNSLAFWRPRKFVYLGQAILSQNFRTKI